MDSHRGWPCLVLCLSILLYLLPVSKAQCSTVSVTAGFAPTAGTGEEDSSASDQTTCQDNCKADPRCMAFTYPNANSMCELHTGRSAYKISDTGDSSVMHFYLTCSSGLWNYAGWDIGCGSGYTADTQATVSFAAMASNRWSCWYQCLEFPRCGAWDWDDSGATCNLVSIDNLGTASSSSGWEHHPVICTPEPFNSFPSTWEYWPMFHVRFGKLQSATDLSLLECQASCAVDSTCAAVDWDVDKKRCWFHTETTNCGSPPMYQRNMYHMKKASCSSVTDYPPALFTL